MKIIEIKTIEDCFDQAVFREVILDSPVSKEFIFFLGKSGALEYYSEFPNPFFKLNDEAHFTVKGIVGNNTLRLMLKENHDANLRLFIQTVESFTE